jgi:hydrogenase nickel incorporation protein HypA/HybF
MLLMRETILAKKFFDQIVEQPARAIVKITIVLGEFSETHQSLLEEQWRRLAKGTPLEHAQLHIRLIPAEVQCMACFSKYRPLDKKILCPHCGSFGAKILSGEECSLESIEAEHDQD